MNIDNDTVKYVTDLVIREIIQSGHIVDVHASLAVPVGISARHVHLQPEHLEILFGKGHRLTSMKALSQPGQFAAEEIVELAGPKGKIGKVRILGPERTKTQVEVSSSDARILGVPPVVRSSGNHEGTPGLTIIGPKASVSIERGVILADRHIHISPLEAERFGVINGDYVRIIAPGPKGGIMNNVTIRVHEDYRLELHIDTDDANAFLLRQGDMLELIK